MTGRDLDVDLVGAAQLVHRSYEWFRRNWRDLVRDEGFPSPFVGGQPHVRPWWRAKAIEAWKDARSGMAMPTSAPNDAPPPPANDPVRRPVRPGGRASKLLATAGAPR